VDSLQVSVGYYVYSISPSDDISSHETETILLEDSCGRLSWVFTLALEGSVADEVATLAGDTTLAVGVEAFKNLPLIFVVNVIEVDERVRVTRRKAETEILPLARFNVS
jgi:hypothetical protein